MRVLVRVAVILGAIAFSQAAAGEILLSVAPGGGQRPADALLRKIDSTDGSTVPGATVTMTLSGHTIVGATGLARHPHTGVLYALLKVEGSSFRRLVTLDESTGVATDIGDTGRRFAGIAFGGDGTLYAVTGDGSGVSETLFAVSTSDASSTQFMELGSGSDGETIGFNPDDGLLYHASGIGTPNHPNGEQFESIDLDAMTITNVPLSGFDYEELTAITYSGGAFFAGDLGSSTSDMPRFFRVTAAGEVSLIGSMDHVSKGLAVAVEPPPPVPALSRPFLAALAIGLALGAAGAGAGQDHRRSTRRESTRL